MVLKSKYLYFLFLVLFFNNAKAQFPNLTLMNGQTTNRSLDLSKEVGTIQGEFTVSPTGAANYQIPIDISPGTNGVQPSISINYNHQSGYGVLGSSWGLGGLSAITRAPNTFFYDDIKKEILLDDGDQLMLDGQRLLLRSGSHMQNNAEYGFEIEDYTRVKLLKSSGGINGPESFEVTKNDGTVLEYGLNNSAVKVASGVTYMWRLYKSTDVHGNSITYNYGNTHPSTLDGESYIDNIQYTSNLSANISAINSIHFNYAVYNNLVDYLKGHPITKNLVLTSIEAKQNNNCYNKYEFEYFNYVTSYYSLNLGEIHQIKNGKSINSTVINWGEETNTFEILNHIVPQAERHAYSNRLIGDFNGDGKSEYIVYDDTYLSLYINNGSNSFTLANHDITKGSKGNALAYDLNKDGRDEIITLSDTSGNTIIKVYSLGNDNVSFVPCVVPNGNSSIWYFTIPPTEIKLIPGDFDGDGHADILLSRNFASGNTSCCAGFYNTQVWVGSSLISLSFFTNELTSNLISNFSVPGFWSMLYSADFNGNGVTDLFGTSQFGSTNRYIGLEFNKTNVKTLFLNNLTPTLNTAHERRLYPADYNGDGKSDILTYNQSGNYWKLYLSKGEDFICRILNVGELPIAGDYNKVFTQEYINGEPVEDEFESACDGNENITLGDFNGDGKIDIAYLKIKENDADNIYDYYIQIFYSNGYGFINSGFEIDINHLFISFDGNTNDYCTSIPKMFVGDYNGDGRSDMLITNSTDSKYQFIYFNKNSIPQLVTKITNGYNNVLSVDYETLANNIEGKIVYQKTDFSFTPSIVKIQGPMYVVSSVNNPNGIGGISTTTYLYRDLLSNPLGRELLGFYEVRIKYPNNTITVNKQLWSISSFLNTYNATFNYIDNDIYATNLNSIVSKNTNDVKYIPDGNTKFKWQENVESFVYDYKKEVSHLTNFEYYTDHYLKKTTVTSVDELSGNEIYKKVNEILEYKNLGIPFGLRPKKIVETSKYGNENDYERTKTIDYFSNGDLKESIQDPFEPKYKLQTNFEYYPSGVLWKKALIGNGKTRSETFEYDTYDRFIKKSQDDQFSTVKFIEYSQNSITGQLEIEKDIEGNFVQTKSYDEFKRPKTITDRFGNTTYIDYKWSDKPGYLYFIESNGPNQPSSKEYFDVLGRSVYKENEALNGTIVSSKTYNSIGQVTTEEQPRFFNEAPKFVNYTYDYKGDLSSSTDDCGRAVNLNYPTLRKIETTDPAGRISSVTDDGIGNIIETEDIGGNIISTNYYSNLKPKSITSHGKTTSFEYDIVGNKTAIVEPNAGRKESEFNAFGLLIKTEDDPATSNANGKGNSILYEYYPDNSLKKKTIFHKSPANAEYIDFSYQMDISKFGFGLIEKIHSSFGTEKNYNYNSNRQIQSTVDVIKLQNYTTTYSYNSEGRLSTTTYPNMYSVTKLYDSRGFFNSVVETNSQRILYSLENEDSKGREISAYWGLIGNPFSNPPISKRAASYTDYGSCDNLVFKQLNIVSNNSFKNILQYTVTVNSLTGNVSSRSDDIKQKIESFQYDNQDRLISILKPNGMVKMSMQYEPNGNIDSKSDVGDYRYYFPQPHALSSVHGNCDVPWMCLGEQNIQYNGYDKANSIMQDKYQMNIDYDVNSDRNHWELYQYNSNILNVTEINNSTRPNPLVAGDPNGWGDLQSISGSGLLVKEKFYAGLYERVNDIVHGTDLEYVYLSGPHGIFGVNISNRNTNNNETYFIQKDYLGSFVALINSQGDIVEEYSYDAWGRRRNPYDWGYSYLKYKPSNVDPVTGEWYEPSNNGDPQSTPPYEENNCTPDYGFLIDRGYIGQEHHDLFTLINLNARLYDPVLGRMLSPDPLVGDPANSQNFNRYSYANNNPLKYVDPNGENLFLILALPAIISMASYTLEQGISSNWTFRNWSWGAFIGGGIMSAVQGGFAYGIGNAFEKVTNIALKVLGSAAAHGLVNTVISSASGGDFLTSFATGFVSSFMGSITTETTGGIKNVFLRKATIVGFASLSSGTIEEAMGGSFWEGSAKGMIISIANHISHSLVYQEDKGDNSKIPTLDVANEHFRNGYGDITAKLSDVDLANITAEDFPDGIGSKKSFDLLIRGSKNGPVLGHITLKLVAKDQVRAYQDHYDFEMHEPRNLSNLPRNYNAYVGGAYAGKGTSYNINLIGSAHIPQVRRQEIFFK